MPLLETDAEILLDHRAERDALGTEQPTGEFGVEQAHRSQSDLVQAGQILVGCVQDPLRVADRVVEIREFGQRDRVDEYGAQTRTTDLDQVGALAVAVAGGTFGVDGDRSRAGSHLRDHIV